MGALRPIALNLLQKYCFFLNVQELSGFFYIFCSFLAVSECFVSIFNIRLLYQVVSTESRVSMQKKYRQIRRGLGVAK